MFDFTPDIEESRLALDSLIAAGSTLGLPHTVGISITT